MAKLTKELLEQNLAGLQQQAGSVQANAMYEAGRKVGQVEGQQALLKGMIELFGAEEVANAADEDPELLKLVEGELGDSTDDAPAEQ